MNDLDRLLREEKEDAEKKLELLIEEITQKQEEREKLESRLTHIRGLLGPGQQHDSLSFSTDQLLVTSPGERLSVTDLAEAVLNERNKEPMHYRNLAAEIQKHGGVLAGKDPANTLVARLSKDDRFIRPFQKGCYALRKDYPDASNVGARHKPS